MQHTRKMVIVPEESLKSFNNENNTNNIIEVKSGENKDSSKKRIERDIEKIKKLILIILKIAKHNGYDENLKLLDENGAAIEKSDLVSLLNHSLTHQKVLYGEERFIKLLHEANVDPNWIVNENVKSKLLTLNSKTNAPIPMSPERPRISESPPPDIRNINRQLKRKHEESNDNSNNWDTLNDDDVIETKKRKHDEGYTNYQKTVDWDTLSDDEYE